MAALSAPGEILAFWRAAGREQWFGGGPAFDAEVRAALLPAHEAAARGELAGWIEDRDGALALLILLDQVPRNVFRGTPRAFATDAAALAVAEAALARGFDRMPEEVGSGGDDAPARDSAAPRRCSEAVRRCSLRGFFYLPFMHAEDPACQERCVALYRAWGEDADGLEHAVVHQDIITRFGRFPHRNPILGRPMTAGEQSYLDAGGFAG